MDPITEVLLNQGVLGVVLAVSLGFNWFLVRTVVGALKENTQAMTALKTLIEAGHK